jgi:opacity protein-like surface antigen
MNRILSIIVFLSIANFAVGQNHPMPVRPKASIGAEIAIPTGIFADLFSVGVGGSGKLEIPITAAFYGTATAGFTSFYKRNSSFGSSINDDNRSYVPLKLGGKYYLSEFIYSEVELGVSIGIQEDSGNSFAWGPGLGIAYPINDKSAVDVGLRYEKWSRHGTNLNQLGIRVAYQF